MAFESNRNGVSVDQLRGFFSSMLRIRLFEERVADLILTGEIRTPCHLCLGQEAVAAGACAALEKDDFVWGGHRSHGHYLAKGGDLRALMAEIFGKSTGCSRGRGGSMHVFAKEVGILGTVPLVGATISLAVGTALASKLRGDGRISVSFFGDGATEEGHFHESLNLAALYRLPVVFVCENNLYSSHMHISDRRPLDNIFETAKLYAIPGVRVDGNDVVAVYCAVKAAAQRARSAEGPSLLECRTYRWRGHVGPDPDLDVGVRRRGELQEWQAKDPVAPVRERLVILGLSEPELETVKKTIGEEIEEAVAFSRRSPFPAPTTLAEHVFYSAEGV